MNPRQVEAFIAIIGTGTTTAAAERLHIGQPAVSRLIRDFELAVGLKLFVRSKNRLTPTTEALTLYREARRCFDGFRQIFQCADEIRSGIVGGLRIVAMPALALRYLTRPVAELLKSTPNLSVMIHCELSQNIPPLVASGRFDIGIGSLPLAGVAIRLEPLPTLDAVCVMAPGHPLAKHEVVELRALDGLPLLCPSGGSLLRARLQMAMTAAGLQPQFRVESSTSATLCALALQGVGIAIVDPFAAMEYAQQGLVVRPLKPSIPYESTVLLPNELGPAPVIDRFLIALKQQIHADFGVTGCEEASRAGSS